MLNNRVATAIVVLLVSTLAVAVTTIVQSTPLLLNGDFSSETREWKTHEERDTRRDLHAPKFWPEFRGRKHVLQFQSNKHGLHQAIFFSNPQFESLATSPLVLSYSYLQNLTVTIANSKKTVEREGVTENAFVPPGSGIIYMSIKYEDGTLVPHFFPMRGEGAAEGDWIDMCHTIPSLGKKMVSILVALSVFDIFVPHKSHDDQGLYLDHVRLQAYDGPEIVGLKQVPCFNVVQKVPQYYQTHPFALVAQIKPDLDDVTLVTQLSTDRLSHLTHTANQYKGPISAAVYIRRPSDYYVLMATWAREIILQQYVTIHLVFEDLLPEPNLLSDKTYLAATFPVNYNRNIARKYAQTLYVLYIDADFTVPSTLYGTTNRGQLRKRMKSLDPNGKVVLVLPSYSTEVEFLEIRDRAHALELIREKKMSHIQYPSHWYVDFMRWEKHDNEEYYTIKWPELLHFEPYFIAPQSVPLFSERFVGGGRDKVEQTIATHLAGFQFVVWKRFFICHMPHPAGVNYLMPHGWPPAGHLFINVVSNYWMVFQEFFTTNKLDFLSSYQMLSKHKAPMVSPIYTVMKEPHVAHNQWFQFYLALDGNNESGRERHLFLQLVLIICVAAIFVYWIYKRRGRNVRDLQL